MSDSASRALERAELRSAGLNPLASAPIALATHGSLDSVEQWVQQITQTWRTAISSILEVGHLLRRAKSKLKTDDFALTQDAIPFGERTTERLIASANASLLLSIGPSVSPAGSNRKSMGF